MSRTVSDIQAHENTRVSETICGYRRVGVGATIRRIRLLCKRTGRRISATTASRQPLRNGVARAAEQALNPLELSDSADKVAISAEVRTTSQH